MDKMDGKKFKMRCVVGAMGWYGIYGMASWEAVEVQCLTFLISPHQL